MFLAWPSKSSAALRRWRMRFDVRLERKCEVNMWLCNTLPVADTRNRFFMPLLGLYFTFVAMMVYFLAKEKGLDCATEGGGILTGSRKYDKGAMTGKDPPGTPVGLTCFSLKPRMYLRGYPCTLRPGAGGLGLGGGGRGVGGRRRGGGDGRA